MVKNKNSRFDEYKIPTMMIGGSLLIAIIAIIFVGRPLYNEIRETSAEVKERKTVLELKEKNLENLKKLESQKEDLEEKNKTVLAALPTDSDVSRLFIQFESIAAKSGLIIKSVSGDSGADTAGSESTGGIKELNFSVSGSVQNYESFKSALNNFNTALRILSIESFDLSGDVSPLNVQMKITTYARQE